MSEFIQTTCAVVRQSDGLIINMIVATPSDPAPDGCQLVEIMNGQQADIGWFYINGAFEGPRTFAVCRQDNHQVASFLTVSYASPVPDAPAGYYSVEVSAGTGCGIGWTWDGATFTSPVA